MSAGTPATRVAEVDRSLEWALRRRRCRRRWLIATVVVVVVAAVAVTVVVRGGNPFARKPSSHGGAGSAGSVATSLATVTRRELSSQTQVSATLGYAGSYTVTYHGGGASPGSAGGGSSGTFTGLPAVGTLVRQGGVLYRVDNSPVILLYGSTPAYRSLAEGGDAAEVTGPDVAQLNHDLVTLGYVNSSDVDSAWDQFNWATKAGVEKLQAHLGVDQTGTLALGQVVFLPTAARVTSLLAKLGGQAGGPVLTATSTTRQVSIALDTSQQSYVTVGDKVTITLPNNQTIPGVVSSVGTVASSGSGSGSSSSSPTVTVLVTPSDPAATGTWDQAPVTVTITTATVHNAVVVPVTALLARAGGGYAVEVADAEGTHRLVAVTLGVFDDADGLVQVSGSGLAAGQRVVVPTV